MNTNRLEAFSDGVIAIIITIMVLEFKVPHGAELQDLLPLWPVFLSTCLALCMWAFIGITITTCSIWCAASMAVCCEPT
jgi:uncharacterized membrane protein